MYPEDLQSHKEKIRQQEYYREQEEELKKLREEQKLWGEREWLIYDFYRGST